MHTPSCLFLFPTLSLCLRLGGFLSNGLRSWLCNRLCSRLWRRLYRFSSRLWVWLWVCLQVHPLGVRTILVGTHLTVCAVEYQQDESTKNGDDTKQDPPSATSCVMQTTNGDTQ